MYFCFTYVYIIALISVIQFFEDLFVLFSFMALTWVQWNRCITIVVITRVYWPISVQVSIPVSVSSRLYFRSHQSSFSWAIICKHSCDPTYGYIYPCDTAMVISSKRSYQFNQKIAYTNNVGYVETVLDTL